jgi:adenosylcobyric acid synthase
VADPHGVEGAPGVTTALGLLEIDTTLTQDKRLAQVNGHCAFADAATGATGATVATVSGYEIHMGSSHGAALARPAFHIADGIHARPEGARSADDQILGSYLHGMFDTPDACAALLAWAGLRTDNRVDLAQLREASLDRIADASAGLLDAITSLPQWECAR